MPEQKSCEILRAARLNGSAFELWVEAGGMALAARPGQFVNVRCGGERLLRRPISICMVEGTALRIVFEVRGEGTRWLSQRQAGEALDVLGPLGNGFDLTGERLLLVGGGIGVPPLLWAAARCEGEVCAVLGFHTAGRALLTEEFQKLCRRVDVTSDDGSVGARGFADAAVRHRMAEGESYARICACGPRPMLRGVAAAAEEYHVPCQVSMEERMGCGVGACLVCACKTKGTDGTARYSHVCKDGPVFDAKEVAWDE